MSISLSILIPYCQYSICTKFHVKWTNIFWDTACFFIVGFFLPPPSLPRSLDFQNKLSPNKQKIREADLDELKPLFIKTKCLICVIDVFTKYAWVKPLKDKNVKTVLNALIEIVHKSHRKANKLWVNYRR